MMYTLKKITLRTNNSKNGIEKINAVWKDIITGKLPIIVTNENTAQQGVYLISEYSNYESDSTGDYDLSIYRTTNIFFKTLERKVKKGTYKKYLFSSKDKDIEFCTKNAWSKVWKDEKQKSINRAYTIDYEYSIASNFSKDKKTYCYLYIAAK